MYRVFLADDEPWALMALKNMIDWKSYGFVVSGEAEDGKQALERIEHTDPDLIISDIRMPGMDGLALMETLRKLGRKTPVLLVSGYTEFEYARKAMQLGCVGYLVKPVEENELIEYLKKIHFSLDENREKESERNETEEGYLSECIQVKKMIHYIQKNYAKGLTLQVLADEFGLNESYISSLIKKQTGKGFSEHLMEIRIQKAQELLRTSNERIETIASSVGYPDYYYFIKVYKKATGISPAAFRKQL